MSSSSRFQLHPLILTFLSSLAPQILALDDPDTQAQSRALAIGEARGKGNQDTGKPKTQHLSSTGIWFQEAHVVPIRMTSLHPLPQEIPGCLHCTKSE